MTESTFTQILTLAVALVTFISSLLNRKKMNRYHLEINGRMSELLESKHSQGSFEGEAIGRTKAINEQRDREKP